MADLTASKDVVAPDRTAEEMKKRDLITGDGLSSSNPIDLVKDSCPLEESGSSKAACSGSGNRGKEQFRFGFIYHTFLEMDSNRFDSSFYLIHCIMNYMGSGLAHGCSQDGLKKIWEYIAHTVLTMDGNIGVLPK